MNHLLTIFLFLVAILGQAQESSTLIWNLHCLNRSAIFPEVDTYIGTPSPVVTDKKVSISGDPHNFESFSMYFWPDTLSPDSPYVYRDCLRNPEGDTYDLKKINALARRTRLLSQAYHLTRNQIYANQWLTDIQAWFIDKQTRMNPNFDYAQFVKNLNNNRGNYFGIIEAYVFVDIIESIRLMRSYGQLDRSTDRKLQKWFRQFARWLRTSPLGIKQSQAPNNLSVAYDVMSCAIDLYIGDTPHFNILVQQFADRRLYAQIQSDGSQPQEMRRALPLTYAIYNLQHVTDFCVMLYHIGIDYYHQHQARIDAAIKYIQQQLADTTRLNAAEQTDHHSLTVKTRMIQAQLQSISTK